MLNGEGQAAEKCSSLSRMEEKSTQPILPEGRSIRRKGFLNKIRKVREGDICH